MKNVLRRLLFVVVGFGALTAQDAAAAGAPESFAPLAEALSPTVVNISTTQKIKGIAGPQMQFDFPPGSPFEQFQEFFDQYNQQNGGGGQPMDREAYSLGSGVIIDAEGYIVTNHHVVEQADEIKVILHNDEKYTAKVIGSDPKTDLALLKIEAHHPLPFAEFGDSDEMKVGDWIVAIGNPYGLGGTVTAGIISARARDINAGPFDDFLQTDAAINRGNSGGPMFNLSGKIVGINSAIFSPTGGNIGIGSAIPSALVQPVLKQLRSYGEVRRAWLGVKIQTVTDEIAESLGLDSPRGALVMETTKGSPAEKAGIIPGDIVLSFGGQPIKEMRKLPRQVAETEIGKKVDVTVWRKGAEKKLDITLGKLEDEPEEALNAKKPAAGESEKSAKNPNAQTLLGMSIAPLSDELRQRFQVPSDVKGVAVLDVDRSSPISRKGIRPGDIITRINEEDVSTTKDLLAKVEGAQKQGRKFALLRVVRSGEAYFVTIPTTKEQAEPVQ